MIETVAVFVLTATVMVGVLAAVIWMLRGRLIRVVWSAIRVERERQRATSTGRPREAMYSGSSGDDPALEEEREEERERERRAREFAGKLEAGRVVRQQRGGQS